MGSANKSSHLEFLFFLFLALACCRHLVRASGAILLDVGRPYGTGMLAHLGVWALKRSLEQNVLGSVYRSGENPGELRFLAVKDKGLEVTLARSIFSISDSSPLQTVGLYECNLRRSTGILFYTEPMAPGRLAMLSTTILKVHLSSSPTSIQRPLNISLSNPPLTQNPLPSHSKTPPQRPNTDHPAPAATP